MLPQLHPWAKAEAAYLWKGLSSSLGVLLVGALLVGGVACAPFGEWREPASDADVADVEVQEVTAAELALLAVELERVGLSPLALPQDPMSVRLEQTGTAQTNQTKEPTTATPEGAQEPPQRTPHTSPATLDGRTQAAAQTVTLAAPEVHTRPLNQRAAEPLTKQEEASPPPPQQETAPRAAAAAPVKEAESRRVEGQKTAAPMAGEAAAPSKPAPKPEAGKGSDRADPAEPTTLARISTEASQRVPSAGLGCPASAGRALSDDEQFRLRAVPPENSGYLEARRCLARHQLLQKESEKAVALLGEALKQHPQARYDAGILTDLAEAEYLSQQLSQALTHAEQAERYLSRSNSSQPWRNEARVLELQARILRRQFEVAGDVAFLERAMQRWRELQSLSLPHDTRLASRAEQELARLEILKKRIP